MSLPLVFRIFSGILFINFIGATFISEVWLEQANFTSSPSLLTLSQAFGVSLLGTAFIAFRVPEIAGDSLSSFGQVFSIISLFFVVLISYHLITDQVSGPTATVNLLLNIVFSTLFFLGSKK